LASNFQCIPSVRFGFNFTEIGHRIVQNWTAPCKLVVTEAHDSGFEGSLTVFAGDSNLARPFIVGFSATDQATN
jgi:hypothetical protein